jgi:hypothetical protein
VLVDVDGAFLVGNKELAIAKSEHSQWSEVFDTVGDTHESVGGIRSLRPKVWHGPGLLLVQGENFDTTLGRDSERRVEHIDAVTFGGNVKLVIFAEEFGLRPP